MKKHTKTYLDHFGYFGDEFIPCEMCGKKAVDIHHIEPRQSGGSKLKDNIENLMAVCRRCHLKYGDKEQYKNLLHDRHKEKLESC